MDIKCYHCKGNMFYNVVDYQIVGLASNVSFRADCCNFKYYFDKDRKIIIDFLEHKDYCLYRKYTSNKDDYYIITTIILRTQYQIDGFLFVEKHILFDFPDEIKSLEEVETIMKNYRILK